jgi:hypothetical protein
MAAKTPAVRVALIGAVASVMGAALQAWKEPIPRRFGRDVSTNETDPVQVFTCARHLVSTSSDLLKADAADTKPSWNHDDELVSARRNLQRAQDAAARARTFSPESIANLSALARSLGDTKPDIGKVRGEISKLLDQLNAEAASD